MYLWKGVRATHENRCRRLGGDRNGTRFTTTGDITRTTAWGGERKSDEKQEKTRQGAPPGEKQNHFQSQTAKALGRGGGGNVTKY